MNSGKFFTDLARSFNSVKIEDVLDALGANRRRQNLGVLSVFGAFFAGAIIGAGVSLLLSPKTGSELRSDLSERMTHIKEQVGSAVGLSKGEGRPS